MGVIRKISSHKTDVTIQKVLPPPAITLTGEVEH